MASKQKVANRFAAFNVDSPMGKFAVFVKLEPEMNAAMAREDALSAAQSEFRGAHGLMLRGDAHEVAEVPAEAFAAKGASGWAWLQRGWLPALEVAAVAVPVQVFEPGSAQLIESIQTLLEEANTIWALLPEGERALLDVLAGTGDRALGACLSDGLKAAKAATGQLAHQADPLSSPEM
ncbi:hypothetical protein RCH14_004453 [Massilia sp. MP_M2]|uniref:hypothetical protein n=1 Tax=Massilia sp. MP_M2 TaxID=3071713 RepID=UPI00319E4F76